MALDDSPDRARPWIEAAKPTHPSLIDTQHHVADLYGMVNVPTSVWIDERGRIARPNDVAFGSDAFRRISGIDSSAYLAALRSWVRGQSEPADPDWIRSRQELPTPAMQQARAEFGLALWLLQQNRGALAESHFVRAGELAPEDITIRRGSMPRRGLDPMGPDFLEIIRELREAQRPFYRPLRD